MTELSVILCTHNPQPGLIDQVLEAIASQADAPSFEVILVDNNSTPAVEPDLLSNAGLPGLIVREARQGLSFARACGISRACAPLLCFVDDDNLLSPDYIAQAVRVAGTHPKLGAFGGRADGVFSRCPDWLVQRHIGRYAVRDHGPAPISGSGRVWGPWEPFGAGLTVRSDIARAFAHLVEQTEDAGGLGRSGAQLGSGEDSLFSRIADQMGYQVGYRPELSLQHVIGSERLGWRYLFRLVAGQARAQVALQRICGEPDDPPPPRWREPDLAVRRFISRLRAPGLYEAMTHAVWDSAYWDAQRRPESEGQIRLRAAFAALGREPARASCETRDHRDMTAASGSAP